MFKINLHSPSLKFILLIGVMSLFADMTYEAARSITGPYLASFGASATIIAFVAGLGEFLGYGLRFLAGYLADKTQRYWSITIIGYFINLLAVPALALAGNWYVASLFIVLERIGKAIRTPPRDAMLSHAASQVGTGWAFGLHQALDSGGAMIGPLIVGIVFYFKGGYQESFAILFIPAVLAIAILLFAFKIYPNPRHFENHLKEIEKKDIKKPFWIYLIAAGLMAAGFADFSLIAFHFEKTSVLSPIWIPIAYSLMMGIMAFSSPLLGYLYDKKGFIVLIWANIFSSVFAPFVFLGGIYGAIIGLILWSIGLSAHESLMRAIVANLIAPGKRALAYGIFNAGFGAFWFLGSITIGLLYDFSIWGVIIFSCIIQFLAFPFLFYVKNETSK